MSGTPNFDRWLVEHDFEPADLTISPLEAVQLAEMSDQSAEIRMAQNRERFWQLETMKERSAWSDEHQLRLSAERMIERFKDRVKFWLWIAAGFGAAILVSAIVIWMGGRLP